MILFQHRAVAQCDHKGCDAAIEYKEDACEQSIKDFSELARRKFEDSGWTFYGGNTCPKQHMHDCDGIHQLAFSKIK